MRVLLLCLCLIGCEYNYYDGAGDGGTEEAGSEMRGWKGNFGQARPIPCVRFGSAEMGGGGGAVGLVQIDSEDGEPHPIAITLAAPRTEDITPLAELVAIIEWGIGGASSVAIVDYLDGQVINLIASYVRVSAVQQMIPIEPVPATPIAPTASAFATPGHLPQARSPQRTLGDNRAIHAGATYPILVPPFARTFRLLCLPKNAQALVQIWSDPAHTVEIVEYPVVGFPSADLPIPNDIERRTIAAIGLSYPAMWLYNDNGVGGADITRWRVIFDLAM